MDQFPWEVPPLDSWYIVCINHYIREGEKRIFCAMQRRGRMIEARGPDTYSVFRSLIKQAEAWDKYAREGLGVNCEASS